MTSLAFMLLEVPEPVWNTSTGNCSSCSPRATSAAAPAMAAAMSVSSTPRWPFTTAAAPLTRPSAAIRCEPIRSPEIGKFCTARCVCAPHRASAGTWTSPIESCSVRNPATATSAPPDGQQRPFQVGEEVVPLVVHDDERREVAHLDPPDRLHAELGVLQHLHAGDAVPGQPGRRPADRAQIEPAVPTARGGHRRGTVPLG